MTRTRVAQVVSLACAHHIPCVILMRSCCVFDSLQLLHFPLFAVYLLSYHPVFLVAQVPRVQVVEKTVEIPQLQIVEKTAETAETQTIQGTQTFESLGTAPVCRVAQAKTVKIIKIKRLILQNPHHQFRRLWKNWLRPPRFSLRTGFNIVLENRPSKPLLFHSLRNRRDTCYSDARKDATGCEHTFSARCQHSRSGEARNHKRTL